ncbi:gliding motility-associated C-terminal domain-containing protein [Chryseobacterium formosus]|uniref:Gliding motility-associated C-terminal domain-containing protein n=1 Tax=Chryseobacterium formosus TaxID=1537363 RepID=A0ABT3XJN8_9FLAO|nr:gliding motility-associated C-terminal domain-containing protein [Chryseobacterium formosus]MCX8522363.1 gliding motility-associated C-terminal domain-containing protein [Chryseobacterium formosus]
MKKTLLIFLTIISQMIFAQSDCPTAISVCGNSDISYTPSGPGSIIEILNNPGCLNQNEHFSVWYTFTIATSGTLAFVIDANNNPDDYDFAVYGPNKTCGNLGAPIRCNYAGSSPTGNTGLTLGPPPSAYFNPHLDVIAGETYYLIVDNFQSTANGFSLSWSGTATLASPFNDPALITNPFITPGLPNADPLLPNEVVVCSNPATFNFSTLSSGIINGNTNFTVSYYYNTNDMLAGINAITAPIIVNTTSTYYYSIGYTDPTNPANPINKCKQTGRFKFKNGAITATDATLTECNNNNTGTAVFNLTTANVIADPTYVKKYYESMYDLNNNLNEITNPYQYTSGGGSIFVLVTTQYGCTDVAEVKLNFYPVATGTEATLRSCFIETNPSTAEFNLTVATINNPSGTTKQYYPSMTDAINQTNAIIDPLHHIAPNGVIYIRVITANNCYTVVKVNLVVIPPVYSTVLVDKIICIEDRTTLDAGTGFSSYLWSTGATTQTISNVGVGTYWVKLKTGDCTATQKVKVYASEQPVVSNIEISSNTVTAYVTGGAPAYQYSLDNVNWQDSNVFNNITRGDHTIYVRDSYDCEPIQVGIVVPNLINVITPNGDGVNDVIDYSALAGKQNLILSIFDRYGAKIYQADKTNGYKWDGSATGTKKVPTGNYWYSVTWNENNKTSTPIKFSGWVLVKNRE